MATLLDDLKQRLEEWLAVATKRVRTDGEMASIEFRILGETHFWASDDEEGYQVDVEEKFSTDSLSGTVARKPPPNQPRPAPVCSTCNDTHWMPLGDGGAMCTRCPTPCDKCRQDGGAYCKEPHCYCGCHLGEEQR